VVLSEDYTTYNEEDLLVILQFKEESPDDSKAAAFVLYNKYNDRLISACRQRLSYNKKDVNHDSEIVFNTWWRLQHNPFTYDSTRASGKTSNEKVYRYIRGIMNHEYSNWFNGRQLPEQDEFHIVYDLEDESKYSNERLKALRDIELESGRPLNGLNEAEKAIFFTYLEFRPEGRKIPSEVKSMLSKKFGLSGEDSVITYYHRAKRKIQKYFDCINGKK
jgi:hypothetical protein